MTRRARVCLWAVALAVAGGATGSWSASGLGLGVGPWSAAVARADGDPASDVLLSQDVFVPYSGMSATVERRLFALCAAADRAGYHVKVALIASKSDLGVVPALFNQPQAYARFLSAELGSVAREPVLVVMPAGLGLATQGHAATGTATTTALSATRVAVGGGDALATAALTVVPRLAAAAGHPVSSTAAAAAPAAGASAGTVRHALTALLVLGLLSAAAITAAFVARSRRAVG